MRFINLAPLKYPAGWQARASGAQASVNGGADVNDFGAVWRELKDGLGELFYDKCWYCELPIVRSDNAVDHYRPKGRCSDAAAPHSGYLWLAFEASNYRYSCTYCNSRRKDLAHGTAGGKADRFPLLVEANRLYAPGPLHQEDPALLDPCELHDWELLGCRQEDGYPCSTSPDVVHSRRVQESISVYHLGHGPTCKQRHSIAVRLMSEVDQAKRFFLLSNQDAAVREEFKTVAKRIKRSIDRDAPFSGEMIFLLRGQRGPDHPWIQQLLES